MLTSKPLGRQTALNQLSELYSVCQYYPSQELDPCEVFKTNNYPWGEGGFGECWEGMFLGQHPVAMKCSRRSVPNETATRVSHFNMTTFCNRFSPYIFLDRGPCEK